MRGYYFNETYEAPVMSTANTRPFRIKIYGRWLYAYGYGAYPYDCISKDKHPDALIYYGDGSWTIGLDSDYSFSHRDLSKDSFETTEPINQWSCADLMRATEPPYLSNRPLQAKLCAQELLRRRWKGVTFEARQHMNRIAGYILSILKPAS